MDLMVRKIVVQANPLEANPLHPIEMTAEIGHCRTVLHEFWNGGHKDYYLAYEWDFYGEITTTDPDQVKNLEKWFRSHTPITEDQLLGRTALLGEGLPRGPQWSGRF